MNDAEQYLLRVLRGFVQGEDPGPFSGDWQQLYTLSAMHSVTGILGHSVMSYPHDANTQFVQMMRRQCLQTIALFSQRGEAMAKLTEALSNEGSPTCCSRDMWCGITTRSRSCAPSATSTF